MALAFKLRGTPQAIVSTAKLLQAAGKPVQPMCDCLHATGLCSHVGAISSRTETPSFVHKSCCFWLCLAPELSYSCPCSLLQTLHIFSVLWPSLSAIASLQGVPALSMQELVFLGSYEERMMHSSVHRWMEPMTVAEHMAAWDTTHMSVNRPCTAIVCSSSGKRRRGSDGDAVQGTTRNDATDGPVFECAPSIGGTPQCTHPTQAGISTCIYLQAQTYMVLKVEICLLVLSINLSLSELVDEAGITRASLLKLLKRYVTFAQV